MGAILGGAWIWAFTLSSPLFLKQMPLWHFAWSAPAVPNHGTWNGSITANTYALGLKTPNRQWSMGQVVGGKGFLWEQSFLSKTQQVSLFVPLHPKGKGGILSYKGQWKNGSVGVTLRSSWDVSGSFQWKRGYGMIGKYSRIHIPLRNPNSTLVFSGSFQNKGGVGVEFRHPILTAKATWQGQSVGRYSMGYRFNKHWSVRLDNAGLSAQRLIGQGSVQCRYGQWSASATTIKWPSNLQNSLGFQWNAAQWQCSARWSHGFSQNHWSVECQTPSYQKGFLRTSLSLQASSLGGNATIRWSGVDSRQQRTSEKYGEFGWVEVRNNEPDSLKEQARLRIEAMDREGQTHVFWVTPLGRNRWKIPCGHYTLLVVSSSGEKWSLEPAVIEVQKGDVEKCSMRYETRRVEEFKAIRRQAIVPIGTPQHTQE